MIGDVEGIGCREGCEHEDITPRAYGLAAMYVVNFSLAYCTHKQDVKVRSLGREPELLRALSATPGSAFYCK